MSYEPLTDDELRDLDDTSPRAPNHLEPVSQIENIRRGIGPTAINYFKTECLRGHPFDAFNTGPKGQGRFCRACQRAAAREWARKHRATKKAWP